jgi:hypothetical protein
VKQLSYKRSSDRTPSPVLPTWLRGHSRLIRVPAAAAVHTVVRLSAEDLGLLVRYSLVLANRPGVSHDEAVMVASHESRTAARTLRRALRSLQNSASASSETCLGGERQSQARTPDARPVRTRGRAFPRIGTRRTRREQAA